MEHICRQTYIFLALQTALSDLQIHDHHQVQQIQNLLVNILKRKIREAIDADGDNKGKKASKGGNVLTCRQVCEREFPLQSQNSNSMKYTSLIYDVKLCPTLMKQLRIKDSIIGQFELYSDQNLSKKEQKELEKEKKEEGTLQSKTETKHHKDLKSKVQELIKGQKAELLKKKKEEEKQKRKEAKEAEIKASREQLKKKKKLN